MPDTRSDASRRPPLNSDRATTLLLAVVALLAGYLVATRIDWRRWFNNHDVQRTFETMRTSAIITIPAQSGPDLPGAELADLAEHAVQQINNLMAPQGDQSDIYRLNSAAAGVWVEVDPLTWDVVMEALRWHRLSDGAFDPTIGPVKRLFTFNKGEITTWPDAETLSQARAKVGADKLRYDREGMRLSWATDGMRLDLGAIAKGYAADKAMEVLIQHGVRHAMINIGGELRLLGGKPGQPPTPWVTGIQNPRWDHQTSNAQVVDTRTLFDGAVATSGDYENFFVYHGKRYLHFINPHTGLPLEGGPGVAAGVTVFHPDSGLAADALATTLCVMGPEEGANFLTDQALGLFRRGVEVVMLVAGDSDAVMQKITISIDSKGGINRQEATLSTDGKKRNAQDQAKE